MFLYLGVICKIFTVFFNGCAVFLYKPPPSATDVPFQDQDAVVTTVSLECDLNEAGNKGWIRKREDFYSSIKNWPPFVRMYIVAGTVTTQYGQSF